MQNACSEMPCKHGGTCEEDGRGNYRCICPSGYSGKQCEKEQSKFAENEVTYLTYVIIRGLISSYTLGGRGVSWSNYIFLHLIKIKQFIFSWTHDLLYLTKTIYFCSIIFVLFIFFIFP